MLAEKSRQRDLELLLFVLLTLFLVPGLVLHTPIGASGFDGVILCIQSFLNRLYRIVV